MEGLPTPPNEEHLKSHGSRRSNGSVKKPVKSVHRAPKKINTHAHAHAHAHAHPQSPVQDSHSQQSADGRHKRVWKACERCRMKKTKCDGEFPCKRCKDDGLVCTAGTRKKTEYKQLPRGYAEVLENTQFALIATVHKLYAMVRNSQPWELGEPELNERGQPVIHNIASRLGCIRPNSDMDLPVHSVFPEDEAGLTELARQLEEQQVERGHPNIKLEGESMGNRTDRASSSELDHSDFEGDYRKNAFGGGVDAVAMSPQSLSYNDFDVNSMPPENYPTQSPAAVAASYAQSSWADRPTTSMNYPNRFVPTGQYMGMDMLNQGLLESNFGTIKPHMLSCPNPEVMMGMGDPMIYSGYDPETMRL